MKNNEYIMVGAPIITREIFRKPLIPLNNYSFKPSGGFWSSPYIGNIGISEWFTYLQDAQSIARYKNLNQSTIFTLKEDAKILVVDTPEKILELAKKYPSNHQALSFYSEINEENIIFDFYKLSKDYDGIYINFNTFLNQMKTIVFDSLGANSLLLFNLNCIKEYRKAPIVFDIYNPYSFPYIIEDTIGKPQKIEEESYEHKLLTEITKELYLNEMSKSNNYSFVDYDEYLTTITQNVKTVIEILEKNEDKNLTEIEKYLQSQGMNNLKGQITQNLVLNFLSDYLSQDEERIKKLPKSKIKITKRYSIY